LRSTCRLALAFSDVDGVEGRDESRQHGRLCDRNVVCAENEIHLWGEGSETFDRLFVGTKIGFGAVEPDGCGIVGVSGEEQAIGTIDEGDGVGGVAGGGDDFDEASAQVDGVAIVDEFGDGPGFGAIGFGIEGFGEITADLARAGFCLCVCGGPFGVCAGEIGIHGIDGVELPVATDVVVVGVGIQNDDGKSSEFASDFANVADAHAGVEEQCFLFAEDEVGDDFFGLVWFVDGESVGRDLVDLEPRVGDFHALESFVFGAGKRLAPIWFFGLLWRGENRGA
jgi:hypothetical protein